MNILLVEDDPHKAQRISSFLAQARPDLEVAIARSYQSGLQRIMEDNFSLILLDMSLPTYEIGPGESGFDSPSFAGEEILEEMDRKGVSAKVVIVTQFETFGEGDNLTTLPELVERLSSRFPDLFQRAVFYSPGESTWTKELLEALPTP
jgi:CheY-like chemotaxis protein